MVACLGGGTVVWTCSVHARRAVFMGRRESNCLRQEQVQKAARHAWLCGDEQDGGCVATPTTGKQLGYACESQASIMYIRRLPKTRARVARKALAALHLPNSHTQQSSHAALCTVHGGRIMQLGKQSLCLAGYQAVQGDFHPSLHLACRNMVALNLVANHMPARKSLAPCRQPHSARYLRQLYILVSDNGSSASEREWLRSSLLAHPRCEMPSLDSCVRPQSSRHALR